MVFRINKRDVIGNLNIVHVAVTGLDNLDLNGLAVNNVAQDLDILDDLLGVLSRSELCTIQIQNHHKKTFGRGEVRNSMENEKYRM